MSSWALVNSIIDPAAAEDASHASASSPEIDRLPSRLDGGVGKIDRAHQQRVRRLQLVGHGHHARALFDACARAIAERRRARSASEPASRLMSSRFALRARQRLDDRRDRFHVRAIAADAFLPPIARQPQPARRIELQLHLREQRVDFVGPLLAQLGIRAGDGLDDAFDAAHIGARGRRRSARFSRADVSAAYCLSDAALLP